MIKWHITTVLARKPRSHLGVKKFALLSASLTDIKFYLFVHLPQF